MTASQLNDSKATVVDDARLWRVDGGRGTLPPSVRNATTLGVKATLKQDSASPSGDIEQLKSYIE